MNAEKRSFCFRRLHHGRAAPGHALRARGCEGGGSAKAGREPRGDAPSARVVEHRASTTRMCIGATHFLMKGSPKVACEMALHVLAYNLARELNILGVQPLIAHRGGGFLWSSIDDERTTDHVGCSRRPRSHISALRQSVFPSQGQLTTCPPRQDPGEVGLSFHEEYFQERCWARCLFISNMLTVLLPPKIGLKLVIGQDLALVLWVLKLMPLDVLPHLAHDLRTGQGR